MRPIVQISLDLTDLREALRTAAVALRAGVDWLEVGTPLLLSEGLKAVRTLRAVFPEVPIVADLKTMDGGYLETEMMARAGATHVVVMARAHEDTIRRVVQAGRDFGVNVMGDNLACSDKVAAAKKLEALGCDFVIHHTGFDERGEAQERDDKMPSPLDELAAVVEAVQVPVQAVGGLSIEDAVRACEMGAPLVVIGAPLAIDTEAFRPTRGDLEGTLRAIYEHVRATARDSTSRDVAQSGKSEG